MARYAATLDTHRPIEEVFAYLSDFSTTQEWDPGVIEATRLDHGPVAMGSEFRLLARFLGQTNELTYRIVELEPPTAVALRGENATVISFDRITFEPTPDGTRITYDAELTIKGRFKIADPLLALAFNRVGRRALAGLQARLAPGQAVE